MALIFILESLKEIMGSRMWGAGQIRDMVPRGRHVFGMVYTGRLSSQLALVGITKAQRTENALAY